MRVLLIGGGGREHALAAALAGSPRVTRLYATPGNAGIARVATIVEGGATAPSLAAVASELVVDLVVIGPEDYLALGVADAVQRAGIPAFGPSREAAQLEASKVWSKQLMVDARIPTPAFETFSDFATARKYIAGSTHESLVVKADGLARGKGAQVCHSREEALAFLTRLMHDGALGLAGSQVVVEEFVNGWEFSLMFFTDGESFSLMPTAQDHKPVFDGDRGPNTGGMGAYTPVPTIDDQLIDTCVESIVTPLLNALKRRGIRYCGVVCGNLIVDAAGPRVLEFNARFGDPEAPLVLPLLATDIVDVAEATIRGNLSSLEPKWRNLSALCVSMAAAGYPDAPRGGDVISGLDDEVPETFVFHAGTRAANGRLVTAGGRVLTITGTGNTLAAARERSYERVSKINFEGMHFRSDIGWRALAS